MIRQIGDYTVVSEIARGATTTAYRAYHSTAGTFVLLKLLHRSMRKDSEIVERFRREGEIMARLDHSNVVKVHDFGFHQGAPFLAMEYVEGQSLREMIEAEGPLPIARTTDLARQILEGLACVHDSGVFHRDLKPDNILVALDGQAKIADFGLAALESALPITANDQALGTPAYMPPEQVRSGKPNAQWDVFAFGATLYEMLTGRAAYQGYSVAQSLHRVLHEDAPPLSEFRDDVPPELRKVVEGCLEKSPDDRYASVNLILADLTGVPTSQHAPEGDGVGAPAKVGGPALADAGAGNRISSRAWKRVRVSAATLALAAALSAVVFWGEKPEEQAAPRAGDSSHTLMPEEVQPSEQKHALVDSGGNETPARAMPGTASEVPGGAPERSRPEHVGKNDVSVPENTSPVDRTPAQLKVECIPWAAVFIDGDSMGITPISGGIAVWPGNHQVRLRNPAFPVVDTTLWAGPGSEINLSVNLHDRVMTVYLEVLPWARVYVDGELTGMTPMEAPLYLAPGAHGLHFEHPTKTPLIKRLTAAPGTSYRLIVNLDTGEAKMVRKLY